ncbi:peptidoglycan recognition protein family protein [Methylobacterium cerastii]|uniref:peptidoglycan recognition protein family protein n=1 Tax=Methylobacterium cerastii TaxID=932741 RepID=UPI001EE392A9|nr:peptidoglycan recognition family protein [Methylobacterium cerastii]
MSDTKAKEEECAIEGGKVISPKVTLSIASGIEKGEMKSVNGIIVHQTGGGSAKSALESYKGGKNGAHFLIDKDGSIYQTARVTQKCQHVGNIKSRCYEKKSCTPEALKDVTDTLFKGGQVYGKRVKNLSDQERAKPYPDRYPTNSDSIGIEIVGKADDKDVYEIINVEQNKSLKWLVGVLVEKISVGKDEIFTHAEVSYKSKTEGTTGQWR